ncbi:hypothetical protein JRO89_XS05G0019800 [Xanthoceras sorbifolium]|uniref:N-acetyltransferase domain-containing protein n=1 Tax=Xanthoceras sorbifolium TaxID=99658 RepID=A0ABQ8HZZ6_9ROSI|nr:hypothetical protein JRO89_XS05G0019800 [Xanthoceras sorbifolium]
MLLRGIVSTPLPSLHLKTTRTVTVSAQTPTTTNKYSISDHELESRGFILRRTISDLNLDHLNSVFVAVGFPRRDPEKIRIALENTSSMLWMEYEETKKPVAFARATGDDVFNAIVWDVVVDPSFQGIGLGKAVMERLIDDLLEKGICNIALYSEPRVLGFYRPLGFVADPDGIRGMHRDLVTATTGRDGSLAVKNAKSGSEYRDQSPRPQVAMKMAKPGSREQRDHSRDQGVLATKAVRALQKTEQLEKERVTEKKKRKKKRKKKKKKKREEEREKKKKKEREEKGKGRKRNRRTAILERKDGTEFIETALGYVDIEVDIGEVGRYVPPRDSSRGLGVNVPSQGFVPGIGSYVPGIRTRRKTEELEELQTESQDCTVG